MVQPAAEVTVDEATVRGLLEEQHPDLAALPLARLDAGWDNELWRLGDDLAVRLPRRAMAAPLTVNEHRWLPVLAPRLPLPVAVPVRFGAPSDRYPWPWTVVAWIDGEPGDRAPITDGSAGATVLAGFLRALHVPAPLEAPVHPFGRGGPLRARPFPLDEAFGRSVATEVDADRVRAVWDAGVAADAHSRPPLWLHADLHAANVVTVGGALAGVLDFGDLCAGDPAIDVASAWMLLPDLDAVARFLDGLDADAALVARARAWALRQGLMVLDVGLSGRKGLPGGKPTWERHGRLAVGRALLGPDR